MMCYTAHLEKFSFMSYHSMKFFSAYLSPSENYVKTKQKSKL